MKNNCPFRDSCKRCTHKVFLSRTSRTSRTSSKKKPMCPYKKPDKCAMYNYWKYERNSITDRPGDLDRYLYSGVENEQ